MQWYILLVVVLFHTLTVLWLHQRGIKVCSAALFGCNYLVRLDGISLCFCVLDCLDNGEVHLYIGFVFCFACTAVVKLTKTKHKIP